MCSLQQNVIDGMKWFVLQNIFLLSKVWKLFNVLCIVCEYGSQNSVIIKSIAESADKPGIG